jgi:hypothetical protein
MRRIPQSCDTIFDSIILRILKITSLVLRTVAFAANLFGVSNLFARQGLPTLIVLCCGYDGYVY